MFSHSKTGQKFGPRFRDKLVNTARLEKQEVVETFVPQFREVANNNVKLLALLGDVGPDTAKNWLEGRNLPGLATFINMARISPELRAVAFKLMDPEAEFDPDFQVQCLRFAQAALKQMVSA